MEEKPVSSEARQIATACMWVLYLLSAGGAIFLIYTAQDVFK